MQILLSMLILAANPAATTSAAPDRRAAQKPAVVAASLDAAAPTVEVASADRPADAVEVFRCGFESESDPDYDYWPEGWTRVRDARHPLYLPIEIAEEPSAEGAQHLKMALNGGGATALSPAIPVESTFSYVLEGSLQTEQLVGDRAWLAVLFYDANGKLIETASGLKYRELGTWTKLRVGPIAPGSADIKTAKIGLYLEPQRTADLRGLARWDDIWLGRLPRMELKLNAASHVYKLGDAIEVSCSVSGVLVQDPQVVFEVTEAMPRIAGKQVVDRMAGQASKLLHAAGKSGTGISGVASWQPKVLAPGLYNVRTALLGATGAIQERRATLAVVEPAPPVVDGEFGWTLPHGERALSLASLATLLGEMGVSAVKFPVWVSPDDDARLDAIMTFAERLNRQNIELVGLLHDPPEQVHKQLRDAPELSAADIFTTEPELWYPLLEPVITRLQLQIRSWQLGNDDDMSFVGYPRLDESLATVRQKFERFGQRAILGIGWRATNDLPNSQTSQLDFVTIHSDPPLTDLEQAAYLDASRATDLKRWVLVEPLPRNIYATSIRVSDLVRRMTAAKLHGASTIYVGDPFHPDRGLLEADGTPGVLLLPWRTIARTLAGTEYLGSIQLPGGSVNHLFARDGEVVMVLWNEHARRERIFLGDNVRQLDLWGRRSDLRRESTGHEVEVSATPVILTGIEPAIARWNLDLAFETTQLPSYFGVAHNNAIKLRNDFGQGIGAQMRLVMPDVWKVYPRVIDFKMASGEHGTQPFSITLPLDAGGGKQQVRLDFDVQADRRYQFSVYRNLVVGLGDVTLEATAHINDRGELEVEQRMTNFTAEPVSFKCLLFAPGRRRMISQVVELGEDRDTKTYALANGQELMGQTLWLRAEEIGGQRILNYRFTAQD
jgi:hypothetical protein